MIRLTTDKKQLAAVLWNHAQYSRDQFVARRTSWLLAWYYLQGYRRFSLYDPEYRGDIRAHLLEEDGQLPYKSEDLSSMLNRVSGRLEAHDIRPSVSRMTHGLSSFRDATLAQVILDSVVSEQQLDKVKNEAAWFLTSLGFCGISGHVRDLPTVGLAADLEVIHPRELHPFPATSTDHTKAMGIMRERMVPMSYLKTVFGKKIDANKDQMEWYEVEPGDDWNAFIDDGNGDIQTGGAERATPGTGPGAVTPDVIGVAKIRELWLDGPGDTCSRYVVASGNYVLDDQDLSDQEVYCPIATCRFFDNGTWYGMGMFDLLFSINRHTERLVQDLFRNIQEIDRYGVLVLPSGQVNQDNLLRDIGNKTMKALFWEPDTYGEGARPFHIQPHNTGDIPGKIAAFGRQIMQEISPHKDLVEEKGRIDSASGLQYLEEQMNRHLSKPSMQLANAIGRVYRSVAQQASSQLTASPRALPLRNVNLDMVGAVIDFERGEVSFSSNPIPRLRHLRFSIKTMDPKSSVARKQEAKELWGAGLFEGDVLRFKLQMLRDDIDIPIGLEEIRGSYEVAVRLMLQLFNDGQQPGEIVFVPHLVKPDIVMAVYEEFTTGPHLQYASVEVQNAFLDLQETLLSSMGMTLPSALPNPDEAAMLGMMPPPELQGALPGGPLMR